MLDKAQYSAFESTLNSPIVSYRIVVDYEVVVNYCPSLVPRACCLYGNCVLTSFEYLSILFCSAAWLAAVPGAATEWDNAKVSGTVRYQVKGFRRPKAETSCD